jgi:hypothetical protein
MGALERGADSVNDLSILKAANRRKVLDNNFSQNLNRLEAII